ncbi:MAG: type IV pilus modification PilV family protein [Opitutales bacterium]|jgi:prepilin-type N-terminal cleavage/methylation domain-containing protein
MRAAARPAQQSKKGGFTLVEVIVSMFLMAIVFNAALGTYFLGMRMIGDAREEIRASQIIQSELERLRTKNWGQLNGMSSGTFTPTGEFVKYYAVDYRAYRYLIKINDDQYQVTIRVDWVNERGKRSTRWFNTIFTRNGLNDYYYRDV